MAFSFATPAPQQQQPIFGQIPQTPFSQPSGFQFPQQQQPQQQQQQQQQFQFQQAAMQQTSSSPMLLFTSDKQPAGYNTKYDDLHQDSQKLLLQIQERVQQYRDESQRLDQCARLFDSSVVTNTFERAANRILQELQRLSITKDWQDGPVQRLITTVKEIMRQTETAIRSYMMLRPRFLHRILVSSANVGGSSQIVGAQQAPASTPPVYDFYSGTPKRPSPFLEQTYVRFETYLGECCRKIEELEELLLIENDRPASRKPALQTISKIMKNNFDFLMHLAGEVGELHESVESMKTTFLADRWRRGIFNDPFLEADRREAAQQEANSKRVHPTLHKPLISVQPSTQVAGLFSSSTPPTAIASGFQQQQPSGSQAASSMGAFSVLGTPSTSSFSTPATSAPSSLFASTPGFTQPIPLASSSASLIGSAPSSASFGSSTPSFGSTLATGSSSLFSSPFGSGAVTGSGSSFGAAARNSRSKSRPTRR